MAIKINCNNRNSLGRYASCACQVLLFCLMPAAVACAAPTSAPVCDALVGVGNQLVLAKPSGEVVWKITTGTNSLEYAAVAPDGNKVAYVPSGETDVQYQVADKYGRTGTFPVYNFRAVAKRGEKDIAGAQSPLVGLSWASDNVVRLEKHIGPDVARFEFDQIPDNLTPPSPATNHTGFGSSCALRRGRAMIACVHGDGITVDKREVFQASAFSGITPSASVQLSEGSGITTSGSPSVTIKIIGIKNNAVGLSVTLPNGVEEHEYVPSGVPMKMQWNFKTYGFVATIINSRAGLVRVDEVISNSPSSDVFDPAIAWQPQGLGVVLVRRTDSQSKLYVVRPSKQGGKWTVVAAPVIDLPNPVEDLRFATPSLLWVKDGEGRFSELPIKMTMTEGGTVKVELGPKRILPATLDIEQNGKTTKGNILDWSCGPDSSRGH